MSPILGVEGKGDSRVDENRQQRRLASISCWKKRFKWSKVSFSHNARIRDSKYQILTPPSKLLGKIIKNKDLEQCNRDYDILDYSIMLER